MAVKSKSRQREIDLRDTTKVGLYIDDLDFDKVWCKTLGHTWDIYIPMMKPSKMGYRLSLRCVRCTSERHDIISIVNGSLIQREYRYVEGYKLAMKYNRDEFRAVLVRHLRAQDKKARKTG